MSTLPANVMKIQCSMARHSLLLVQTFRVDWFTNYISVLTQSKISVMESFPQPLDHPA